MMHRALASTALILFATTIGASASPDHDMVRRQLNSSAIPPSRDPFYQPDPGFESSAPGTILRSRKLETPWNGTEATYQLLFRSTDSNGEPSAVVTTILQPPNADPKKFLSDQDAYDSAFVDCAVSTNLRPHPLSSDPVVGPALADGWYINVPDFLGFTSAFANGMSSGQSVLDSIRATLSSTNITGVDKDAVYSLTGYSGGSSASEWATELLPSYAPELNITGTAIGGTAPNSTESFLTCNKGYFAGVLPNAFIGISAQDYELRAFLLGFLVPEKSSDFLYSLTHCAPDTIEFFLNQDITSYFQNGYDLLREPRLQDWLNKYSNYGSHGTPQTPFYIWKGVLDNSSNITDTDNFVDQYCAGGASIQYIRNQSMAHTDGNYGAPLAYAWLKDRMNSIPATPGCNITTIAG